jgi:hypothetical protein
VYATQEERSPFLQEVARLKAPLAMPGRTLRSNGKTHRLTPEQYSDYVQLSGKPARQYLETFIKTPEWKALDDDGRREVLQETMEEFRGAARTELRERYPELDRSPDMPAPPPGFQLPPLPEGFVLSR